MSKWTWLTYSGQGHHASLDDAARAPDALLQSLAVSTHHQVSIQISPWLPQEKDTMHLPTFERYISTLSHILKW